MPESCAAPPPLTAQLTFGAGLPESVRLVSAIPPVGTVTVVGEAEICGACALLDKIWTLSGLEVADPGLGFVTVICMFPTSEVVAVPLAVTSAEETTFVASGVAPKYTTAPCTNDAPETVTENEPALSCDGETEESCGTGLSKFVVSEAFTEALDVTVALMVTAAGAGTLSGAI